jgi:hypothetical protein
MEIAYIFHGHSRTWKDCYQSFFDNVYSVAPGDIYIHTWDRVNGMYGSFWNKTFGKLNPDQEAISSKTLDLDGIIKTYKPAQIIVESDMGLETPFMECPQLKTLRSALPPHIAAYNMFRSQYISYYMARSRKQYDKYFACRMDLAFTNKLDADYLHEENVLMAPPTFTDYDDPRTEMIFDIYALAPEREMELKANFYNNIWEYWYSTDNLHAYYVEHAITRYYRDNGLRAKPINLNFEVKRLF